MAMSQAQGEVVEIDGRIRVRLFDRGCGRVIVETTGGGQTVTRSNPDTYSYLVDREFASKMQALEYINRVLREGC
jgi:hypothetical protein